LKVFKSITKREGRKLFLIKKDSRWLVISLISMVMFICLLLLNFKITDINFKKVILAVRSENSDQIFMVVSFFSGFSITLTLSIVVSIAVWKFSSQLKNVIWIVLSILSSKELVLWFDKIFYSKLINDHVLLTTIFFLIILTTILPILEDPVTQILIFIADFIWLAMVIAAQFYLINGSITELLLSLTLAVVWWEVLRIVYLVLKKI
jgi:phosphatidylserine synthase